MTNTPPIKDISSLLLTELPEAFSVVDRAKASGNIPLARQTAVAAGKAIQQNAVPIGKIATLKDDPDATPMEKRTALMADDTANGKAPIDYSVFDHQAPFSKESLNRNVIEGNFPDVGVANHVEQYKQGTGTIAMGNIVEESWGDAAAQGEKVGVAMDWSGDPSKRVAFGASWVGMMSNNKAFAPRMEDPAFQGIMANTILLGFTAGNNPAEKNSYVAGYVNSAMKAAKGDPEKAGDYLNAIVSGFNEARLNLAIDPDTKKPIPKSKFAGKLGMSPSAEFALSDTIVSTLVGNGASPEVIQNTIRNAANVYSSLIDEDGVNLSSDPAVFKAIAGYAAQVAMEVGERPVYTDPPPLVRNYGEVKAGQKVAGDKIQARISATGNKHFEESGALPLIVSRSTNMVMSMALDENNKPLVDALKESGNNLSTFAALCTDPVDGIPLLKSLKFPGTDNPVIPPSFFKLLDKEQGRALAFAAGLSARSTGRSPEAEETMLRAAYYGVNPEVSTMLKTLGDEVTLADKMFTRNTTGSIGAAIKTIDKNLSLITDKKTPEEIKQIKKDINDARVFFSTVADSPKVKESQASAFLNVTKHRNTILSNKRRVTDLSDLGVSYDDLSRAGLSTEADDALLKYATQYVAGYSVGGGKDPSLEARYAFKRQVTPDTSTSSLGFPDPVVSHRYDTRQDTPRLANTVFEGLKKSRADANAKGVPWTPNIEEATQVFAKSRTDANAGKWYIPLDNLDANKVAMPVDPDEEAKHKQTVAKYIGILKENHLDSTNDLRTNMQEAGMDEKEVEKEQAAYTTWATNRDLVGTQREMYANLDRMRTAIMETKLSDPYASSKLDSLVEVRQKVRDAKTLKEAREEWVKISSLQKVAEGAAEASGNVSKWQVQDAFEKTPAGKGANLNKPPPKKTDAFGLPTSETPAETEE